MGELLQDLGLVSLAGSLVLAVFGGGATAISTFGAVFGGLVFIVSIPCAFYTFFFVLEVVSAMHADSEDNTDEIAA